MYQRGIEREKECIDSLINVKDTCWDGKDFQAGSDITLRLMKEGHPWISGAVLLTKIGLGFPDLLRREEGNSSIGGHTYIPVDIKQHKSVTQKDRFQLLGYAYLLEPVLGSRPESGGIWLNTGEIEEVNLLDDLDAFESLLKEMDVIRRGKKRTDAVRSGECSTCDWGDYCLSVWEKNESVCLLYGISGRKAKQVQEAGFSSWRDVAESALPDLAVALNTGDEKARITKLYARAYEKRTPQIIKGPDFPDRYTNSFLRH